MRFRGMKNYLSFGLLAVCALILVGCASETTTTTTTTDTRTARERGSMYAR